jgi:Mlc titration factor MtfA (ptsG expression regulator)
MARQTAFRHCIPGSVEAEWTEIFFAAYDDFCRRIDSGEETVIDPYASADPAEFFAVLSECFFELPTVVDREYPALYGYSNATTVRIPWLD